ncbi:MAG TPA: DUF488 family protein [Burkholderiales bacterium]|nr:DUF488 family protein [Burkholderiales bacterium]
MKRRPVKVKPVSEQPSIADGMRVLVDRVWPRGMTKHDVSADLWLRDAAPSGGLRRWYGHDARRWRRFSRKYRTELARQPEVLELLDDLRRRAPVTLIFAARDESHSHAVVLRDMLEEYRCGI